MHAEVENQNPVGGVIERPGLHEPAVLVKEQVSEKFKRVIVEAVPRPIISEEVRKKYLHQFVAFSLGSNRPEWGDAGAAKSRLELAEQMGPLECGKDYYACPIQ